MAKERMISVDEAIITNSLSSESLIFNLLPPHIGCLMPTLFPKLHHNAFCVRG